jgi:hypothetical protein
MFLRRNRRQKNGELYEYWTLVESIRTVRGPRQRVVATLGKLPGLDEDAFRTGKGDLGLRPVYHQKEDRVQAHIFVCFLALAMWRSLEMWLHAKGLGDTARQVVSELKTIHSMDVVLPIRDHRETRLRLVGRPEKLAAELLAHLGLKLPLRPKTIENVVEKNGL